MILLLAIVAGLLAGYLRAWIGRRKLAAPQLKYLWLVFISFLPQLFAFGLPQTSRSFPEAWIPVALIGSQILLLIFALVNIRQPGFIFMGLGLMLNLAVITVNGGWMPISPETIQRLLPKIPPEIWEPGERFGVSKDKIIPRQQTHLWLLSDWLILPGWIPYKVAFSIGDVILALGAFWFLWSLGGNEKSEAYA